MVHLVVFEVPAFALAERNPIEVGALRSLLVTFGVLLLAQAANSVEWFQAGDELAGISGGFASPNVALHAADNVIESHVGC